MNESQIFAAVLRLDTPEDRAAYLDEVCADNGQLRKQVEGLLKAHATDPGFLETPAGAPGDLTEALPAGANAEEDLPVRPQNGSSMVIGPYKLIEEIGEGGMGTVYMAQQTEPVRRLVALKVIKQGMDSRQVIARFEAERQALALMDHPNIAKVFDAGTTQNARPFFVMELVKGVPLTKYCDDLRLTPKERLKLFIPVCQAIQHAHQKGIIHRDIKASNVLVALFDGEPVPKVIDFGVAKATGQQLTEKTLVTGFGALVGTLEYMSPEQAELNQLDIDTRSDIYSLGVLLYELLTGTTPLERKRALEVSMLEMLRVIREEEPPRPSTRLSTMEDTLRVALNRGLEPKKLSGLVRGELDWIVMKALEKNRKRRYETASGLADDVRRYLNHEPVQAGPPSSWYRLQKLARRNRTGIATAAIVATAPVAGAAVATWQAVRATQAEAAALKALKEKEVAREAEASQREIAANNEQTALAREAETNAVLDFVESKVFAAARPEALDGGLGHSVTLRKAVVDSLPFVAASFTSQPLIEARLRMTLGKSFQYLGDARIAMDQFQTAWAIYTRHRGPDHPDTLTARNGLAVSYQDLYRFADAEKLLEETLALQKRTLGTDHPDTLQTMHHLANTLYRQNRGADSMKLCEEILALRRKMLGLDHSDTLKTANSLANSYDLVGRTLDALKLREETLALQKSKLGHAQPDTLVTRHDLARSYFQLGRRDDALRLSEETLALVKAKFGPDHPTTLTSIAGLACNYFDSERFADAERLLQEKLALCAARFGADDPHTLTAMALLATQYGQRGRHVDAIKLFERALALQKAKAGPEHSVDVVARTSALAVAHRGYGDALRGQGKYGEARREYQKSLKLKPDETGAQGRLYYLALELEHQDKPSEAEAVYRDVLQIDPTHCEAYSRLELVQKQQGRDKDAQAVREQLLSFAPESGGHSRADIVPVRRLVSHNAEVCEVDFSPDGKRALSCSRDATIRLWEIDTGKQVRTLRGHRSGVLSIVFSHDGKRALSAGDDRTLRYWDVDTGEELRRFEGHAAPVCNAVFSSDDRRVLSGSRDNTLRLWDAKTGQQLRLIEARNQLFRCIALAPGDRRALSSGSDNFARVWDLETGQELHRMHGHTRQIWHVAISPDGNLGLTGGGDTAILLWDLRTGKQIRRFQGHDSDVNSLVFSPDGKRFLSCGDDKTMRLWDLETGRELRRWTGHVDSVGAVAISPDGTLAFSGSTDTCICLWRIAE